MGVIRDQGIVLRSFRLGEADRIVSLLTQSHGKVRAIVKGVRRTKSRFGARLDPFAHADLQLWEGRSELRIVSQAELISSFARIRDDYDAYAVGQVVCEAADAVAPEGSADTRLVLLVLAALRALDECVRDQRAVPHALRSAYLLKLIGISGYAPSLRCCAHCGGTTGLCAFSLDDGGVLCSACRQPGDAHIHPETVDVLTHLWRTPLAEIGGDVPSGEADGVVAKAVEYHLERRLRSLGAHPV